MCKFCKGLSHKQEPLPLISVNVEALLSMAYKQTVAESIFMLTGWKLSSHVPWFFIQEIPIYVAKAHHSRREEKIGVDR